VGRLWRLFEVETFVWTLPCSIHTSELCNVFSHCKVMEIGTSMNRVHNYVFYKTSSNKRPAANSMYRNTLFQSTIMMLPSQIIMDDTV
jgi:hypothetical protein